MGLYAEVGPTSVPDECLNFVGPEINPEFVQIMDAKILKLHVS